MMASRRLLVGRFLQRLKNSSLQASPIQCRFAPSSRRLPSEQTRDRAKRLETAMTPLAVLGSVAAPQAGLRLRREADPHLLHAVDEVRAQPAHRPGELRTA